MPTDPDAADPVVNSVNAEDNNTNGAAPDQGPMVTPCLLTDGTGATFVLPDWEPDPPSNLRFGSHNCYGELDRSER